MQLGFPKPLRFENPLSKGKRIISGWLKFAFKSRRNKIIAAVLAVLLAIPAGWALADIVYDSVNDVNASVGSRTIVAGDSTSVGYRVQNENTNAGDSVNPCNPADGTVANFTFRALNAAGNVISPSPITVSPSPLVIDSCESAPNYDYASFTSEKAGTYTIDPTVSDTGGGRYTDTAAQWSLTVNKAKTQITNVVSQSGDAEKNNTGSLEAKLSSFKTDGTTVNKNLENKSVVFKVDGQTVGSATTDASGVAKLSPVDLTNVSAGTKTVIASFSEDDGYLSSQGSGSMTVNSTNTAPTDITLSNSSVAENKASGTTVGTFSSTDQDSGDTHTYSLATGTGSTDNTSFTIDSAGTLKTAASFDYETKSSYSIRVESKDKAGATFQKSFTILVTNVNEAPVAPASQSVNTDEDTAKAMTLSASDVDSTTLTYTVVSGPANGTLSGTGANQTYTPAANFNGSDSFTYKASDGSLDSNESTVNITVNAVNDKPEAVADPNAATTPEDTPVDILADTLLGNDSKGPANESGQTLAIDSVSNSVNGTAVLSGDKSKVTFTPTPNFNGTASFDYKVCDNGNPQECSTQTAKVDVTVSAVNDAPVADAQSVNTPEDTAKEITLTGSDVEGSTLTYSVVQGPSHGTLSGSGASQTYTPAKDYNGPDSFTFKANDGTAESNTATVSINVTAVNDAPEVKNDSVTTNEDTSTSGNVLTNDSDVEKDALTATKLSDPSNGTVTFNTDGSFNYTPKANYFGSDSFTYKANDGKADSSAATVTITVDAINDAPVATEDAKSTLEDTLLTFPASDLTSNDTDVEKDSLTVNSVSKPTNGAQVSLSGGQITYTPAADFNGDAYFDYEVCDNGTPKQCTTEQAKVTVKVNAVNDAPSFTAGANQTVDEDIGAKTVSGWATQISAGPSDESKQVLDFIVTNDNNSLFSTQPAVDAADGTLSYTPAADANGTATVTVKLKDDGGTADGGKDTSAAQTFTITVNAVNDAPSFAAGSNQTVNEDAGAQTVSGWATKISAGPSNEVNQKLTFDVTNDNNSLFETQPAIDPATGTLSYKPAADANGTATVTVKLKDDGGVTNGGVDTSAAQTFTINVTAVNDAPVAAEDTKTTPEDTPLVFPASDLVKNDTPGPTDESNQTKTVTAVSNTTPADPGTKSVTLDNGQITFTPADNFNGTAYFDYKVCDNGTPQQCTTEHAKVTVTVSAVNDAPTKPGAPALASGSSSPNQGGFKLSWTASTDVEGNPIHYVLERSANGNSFSPVTGANNLTDSSYTFTAEDEGTWIYRVKALDDSNAESDVSGNSNPVTVDKTAPTIKGSAKFANGSAYTSGSWTNQNVIVSFECADNTGGAGVDACSAPTTLSSDGAGQSVKGDVTDKAGNTASTTVSDIDIDKTKPTLNPSVTPNPVLLNGSATVSAGASDSLSGLAAAATCGSVDTSSVGNKSVSCSATDKAGNSNSASANYNVNYKWDGFRQPVDNNGVFNVAKAGSAIPLKFSLYGNQGLDIMDKNFNNGVPKATSVSCTNSATLDTVEELSAATNSGLTYDATADQYNYVWKTQSNMAGKCYKLDMVLKDGTSHVAYFKFTK